MARDWDPTGRGLRKAGDGDGDGVGEASEGVELEREEEGADRASWREAASELVVDLGTTEEEEEEEGGRQMDKRGRRKEGTGQLRIMTDQTDKQQTQRGKVAVGRILMAVEVR